MPKAALSRVRRDYATIVRSADRITPDMVRLVLGGPDLAEFADLHWADHYVKFALPESGDLPAVTRSYTVRAWDRAAGELVIDVVVHGSQGRVGPWAAQAKPGDELVLRGQGGGYTPGSEYDWHLLIGDESALPAILAAIEQLEPGAKALAFIEVANAAEEQSVMSAGDIDITWIHRGEAPAMDSEPAEPSPNADDMDSDGVYGAELVAAVRNLDFLPGRVQVFLHGEAGMVRELRRHLRGERKIDIADMSVSGYWRLGRDDEAWRAEKGAWKAAVEQDEQQLAS